MRLSTKGRYAVMAMADLASRPDDHAVTLADIAERQEISLAYLEQLFARLRRSELVKSLRGPGGGYLLARPAEAMTIAEIVTAVDEPLHAVRCSGRETGCMKRGERCLTHDLWEDLGRQIHGYLASVTLADVVSGRPCAAQPEAA